MVHIGLCSNVDYTRRETFDFSYKHIASLKLGASCVLLKEFLDFRELTGQLKGKLMVVAHVQQIAAPALAELPDEVRRALPPMRFEGTVYSDTASSRMLMINGQ